MPTPKLGEIKKQLDTGVDFTMTNSQYKKSTGLDIPKNNYYLTNSSAIAKAARAAGYKITIHEREISFEKEQ